MSLHLVPRFCLVSHSVSLGLPLSLAWSPTRSRSVSCLAFCSTFQRCSVTQSYVTQSYVARSSMSLSSTMSPNLSTPAQPNVTRSYVTRSPTSLGSTTSLDLPMSLCPMSLSPQCHSAPTHGGKKAAVEFPATIHLGPAVNFTAPSRPNQAKGSYAIHLCGLGGIHRKYLVESTVNPWWKSPRIFPFTVRHREIRCVYFLLLLLNISYFNYNKTLSFRLANTKHSKHSKKSNGARITRRAGERAGVARKQWSV